MKKCYIESRRTGKGRECDWIGNMLPRNCLIKHVIEEKIEGTGRELRSRKLLLDSLKEMRRFWKLKEDVLDRPLWSIRFLSIHECCINQNI